MTNLNQIFTCADHGQADAAAGKSGVAFDALMNRAGVAVAESIMSRWIPRRTVVLCGPGDNGGDGYVAAIRLARAGWPVRVAALGAPRPGGAAEAAAKAWPGTVSALDGVSPEDALGDAELVIDALFGAGLTRPLTGEAAALAQACAQKTLYTPTGKSDKVRRVVSIDLPSGVSGDLGRALGPAFPADVTVTFGRWKVAHLLEPARSMCGELRLTNIGHPDTAWEGLTPAAICNAPEAWLARWPWPTAASHKHARGSFMVVTGGASSTGAARLAARAGLRAGAGLATLLCPPSALLVAATASTAVMTSSFRDTDALASAVGGAQAVLMGPGGGVGADMRANVAAIAATGVPMVLDADALTSFEDGPDELFALLTPKCVLTPHLGEFRRLFGDLDPGDDKLAAVGAAATRAGCVVLLKGADTVIAAPDAQSDAPLDQPTGIPMINANASPFLATAGSGDVLAGVIGGLISQGMSPFDAAAAGAWLHGATGGRLGPGLIAEDLCDALPIVLADLYQARDQI